MRSFIVLLGLLIVGCKAAQIPDPNDPKQAGMMQPEVMLRNLKWASDAANERVYKGELTPEKAKDMVSDDARKLIESIDLKKIPPARAWEYAEVFRTAKRWDLAEPTFEIAVKNATNEDRRVNDSLRLAHVKAELGKVKEAVKIARSVYNAEEKATAPILPAVLLEIVPAGQGKGDDLELAKLLEDAIPIHDKTIVDEKTQPGKMFLYAKAHHIKNAYRLVQELYERAHRPDLADAARLNELNWHKQGAHV